jgi:hypothetical protein
LRTPKKEDKNVEGPKHLEEVVLSELQAQKIPSDGVSI